MQRSTHARAQAPGTTVLLAAVLLAGTACAASAQSMTVDTIPYDALTCSSLDGQHRVRLDIATRRATISRVLEGERLRKRWSTDLHIPVGPTVVPSLLLLRHGSVLVALASCSLVAPGQGPVAEIIREDGSRTSISQSAVREALAAAGVSVGSPEELCLYGAQGFSEDIVSVSSRPESVLRLYVDSGALAASPPQPWFAYGHSALCGSDREVEDGLFAHINPALRCSQQTKTKGNAASAFPLAPYGVCSHRVITVRGDLCKAEGVTLPFPGDAEAETLHVVLAARSTCDALTQPSSRLAYVRVEPEVVEHPTWKAEAFVDRAGLLSLTLPIDHETVAPRYYVRENVILDAGAPPQRIVTFSYEDGFGNPKWPPPPFKYWPDPDVPEPIEVPHEKPNETPNP